MLNHFFDAPQVVPHPMGLPKTASVYGKLKLETEYNENAFNKETIVLFGVNESRNSANKGANNSSDAIRKYLYALSGSCVNFSLHDLGNLKATAKPSDTYLALKEVLSIIAKNGATCVILGGTQELTWPIYQGLLESISQLNVSFIDRTVDMGTSDGDFSANCYLDNFIKEPKESLFSLNILGYQGYFTNSEHITKLNSSNYELTRLGQVRGGMTEIEPTLRDSHIVSFDISCIRQGDSPGSAYPSPNGFYAEEVCQLARYSGLSQKNKAFGIFELNSDNDIKGQSAHLAAQVIWHFLDAFNTKTKQAKSSATSSTLKRYYVKSPIPNVNLIFLHNSLNDTWWMEFDLTTNKKADSLVIACSYNDYKLASNGDVPDRWLRAWKKMT